ncbi:MAG: hypothetical protein C4547_05690 [Phycisphaerales bacterium]|nr:MAG: hypothetical protein C4547_05690 [Phycisphaerales bacterium]
MAAGRDSVQIKRIRNEVLVALRTVYPAAMQADQIMRSLLPLFPTLEFDAFRRDLHYLLEKGYLLRVVSEHEADERLTAWRRRWFRLSVTGMEIADELITDPALSDS